MKTKVIFLISFVALLFLSCNKNNNEEENHPVNITPVEIGKGALYGNGQEGIVQSNLVITNTSDWQNLINQMDSYNNVSNTFTETNIDFNTYMVIAIFLEVKPNGWEVEISNIIENTSNIIVTTLEREGINTVMTQPYHIVKIPITNKPIEFE